MPEEKNINQTSFLPFGQSKAAFFHDVCHFTDAVTHSAKTLQSYEAIENNKEFNCAISSVKIGGIDLVASSSSPARFSVNETRGLYFCFLYDGRADANVDGFKGCASANEFAFLSPEVERAGETSSINMVQFSMLEDNVLAVAGQMYGQQSFSAFKRSLQRPKNIDLKNKSAITAAFLKGIIKQIDACDLDANLLKMLGVDDVIYRAIATMVADDEGFSSKEKNVLADKKRSVIDATEFIDAHIVECITSTDLERVAGVGARALQYAFLKSYGCSPTQWMRSRRLELAREKLLKSDRDARIVDIALSVGWRNISSFPSAYAERYGELPSETLKQSFK